MSYEINLTKLAERDFSKLDAKIAKQIVSAIDAMEKDPFVLNIKKLKRPLTGYRARSGDYRILFVIDKKRITIYSIRHRKDVYRY